MIETPADTPPIPLEKVISDIVFVNQYIHDFWQSGAAGWSPTTTANLLRRARLDRQVSLSRCLHRWVEEPPANELEGHLILAWANLGSLVEGTMTWFLCVWEQAYAQNPMKTPAGDDLPPDDLRFEKMIRFFATQVWVDWERDRWRTWCDRVRRRRNSIHAYRDSDIGTFDDLHAEIRTYREFLNELNKAVPYPDEYPQLDLRDIDLLRARRANTEK